MMKMKKKKKKTNDRRIQIESFVLNY